jgi:hypothetical protein
MKREQAIAIAEQYCCLDLVAAEGMGVVATASGGVWIGGGHDTGCLVGFPQAKFCPFCGSQIVVTPPSGDRDGWSWHTNPPSQPREAE